MAGINKTACCLEHITCDVFTCPDGTAPIAPTPYCGGVDSDTCSEAICCKADCGSFVETPQVHEYNLTISPDRLDLSQVPLTTLATLTEAVWNAAKSGPSCTPLGFQLGTMRIEPTDDGAMLTVEVLAEPDRMDLLNETQKQAVGWELGLALGREVRRHGSSYAVMPDSGNCTMSSDMAFGRLVTTSINTLAPQLVNSAEVLPGDECIVAQGDEASVTVDLGVVVPVRTVKLQVCAPGATCTAPAMTVMVMGGSDTYTCVPSSMGATAEFLCPDAAGSSLVVKAANSLKLCKIRAFLTTCL